MTDSIFHGLAIGLSLLSSCRRARGSRRSTSAARSATSAAPAGTTRTRCRSRASGTSTLLRDVELIDERARADARSAAQTKAELTLPIHMSLTDIAAQLNPGGADAVRAAGEAEWARRPPPAEPEAPAARPRRRRRRRPTRTRRTSGGRRPGAGPPGRPGPRPTPAAPASRRRAAAAGAGACPPRRCRRRGPNRLRTSGTPPTPDDATRAIPAVPARGQTRSGSRRVRRPLRLRGQTPLPRLTSPRRRPRLPTPGAAGRASPEPAPPADARRARACRTRPRRPRPRDSARSRRPPGWCRTEDAGAGRGLDAGSRRARPGGAEPTPRTRRPGLALAAPPSRRPRAGRRGQGLRLAARLYASVAAALASGRHVVLIGPPGAGKTTLALAVAKAAVDAGKADGAMLAAGGDEAPRTPRRRRRPPQPLARRSTTCATLRRARAAVRVPRPPAGDAGRRRGGRTRPRTGAIVATAASRRPRRARRAR